MKIICAIFLIIVVIINLVSSAVFRNNNAFHPDHPDKCYDKRGDKLFNPGEIFKPIGRCYTLNCVAPGDIRGEGCGPVSMSECKSIGRDLTKPHPGCCERFLCKIENGEEFILY